MKSKVKTNGEIRLNIGSGPKKREGWVNVDISKKYKPEVVASVLKLPFKSSSVDEIFTQHMLEHIQDFEAAMREMHRVLKPGGKLTIIVPAATAVSGRIPQHYHYFNSYSFQPFVKGHENDDYYNFHFKSQKMRYRFRFINKIIQPLTDSGHLFLYEYTFLSHLFPAEEMYVELIK